MLNFWPFNRVPTKLNKLRAECHVAHLRACQAEGELAGLRNVLATYGYPTDGGTLRGKLEFDERIAEAAVLRMAEEDEVADAEAED